METSGGNGICAVEMVEADGVLRASRAVGRTTLLDAEIAGPVLIVDAEATTYVPPNWSASAREDGTAVLVHSGRG